MAQNAHSHRKLKIAGIVALVLVVALLGFAGNFLFDFALNPQAPYTMKMMQDGKDAEKGEQIDAEEGEARAWFKENRESSSLTADDGTELAAWYFAASESTHDYAVCLHGYTNEPIGMARYVKRFHDRGMNVLAPAARAHERSGGDYIGMGWPERLDVVAWIGRIGCGRSQGAHPGLWRVDGRGDCHERSGGISARKCEMHYRGLRLYKRLGRVFSAAQGCIWPAQFSLARCGQPGMQRARRLRLS